MNQWRTESIHCAGTIRQIPLPLIEAFIEWMSPSSHELRQRVQHKLKEPLRLLGIQLAHHGSYWPIRERLKDNSALVESFLSAETLITDYVREPSLSNFEELKLKLDACYKACSEVRKLNSSKGISIDLTYKLLMIKSLCSRIRKVGGIYVSLSTQQKISDKVAILLKEILSAEINAAQISKLFFTQLELVFYEITEHTGQAGETYIQPRSSGYWKMAWKGAIGGLIVGLLSITKDFVLRLGKAPAVEAILVSGVYASIFLLIFAAGGVLATKQPAMTASKIAQEIDQIETKDNYLWELSELLRFTFRTQSIALMANTLIAFPFAVGVYWLISKWGMSTTDETANYFISSLHPWESLSLYYAALTGICLSLSGIIAGASKNWFIYHNLQNRIRSRMQKYFGAQVSNRISNWTEKNTASIAANVSLGVMLGCLAVVGFIFGLPLDVRHITFASAQLGSALAHFNFELSQDIWIYSIVGVVLIGLVNLLVSFGVTFLLVLKSRNVSFANHRALLWLLLKRFLKNPLKFLLPVK